MHEEMRKEAESLIVREVYDFTGNEWCLAWKRKVWELWEKPQTSMVARVSTIFKIMFNVLCFFDRAHLQINKCM